MTDQPDQPQLVDTVGTAEALRMSEHALDELAEAGIVVPAVTDADGERWWVLHDLRRQLAAYLKDRD
jgi:hypothetical protein